MCFGDSQADQHAWIGQQLSFILSDLNLESDKNN